LIADRHIMAANGDTKHHRAVIGSEKNFWLFSSETGFDLSHPPTASSRPVALNVTFKTTTNPITIDPDKSALVIIDMQNFFLSPAFGRAKGAGHAALDQLVQYAVPAARRAGIRIIWLNWGLTDQEIEDMPPAVTRAFGFEVRGPDEGELDGHAFKAKGTGIAVDKHGSLRHQGGHAILEDGKKGKKYKGLGTECGIVEDPETGKEINAGRLLARGAWNSALYPPLDKLFEEGCQLDNRPDVWIHKNRMSGMWGARTECEEFLEKEGIRTLFFSGVNTDQCEFFFEIDIHGHMWWEARAR
jgi:nicotinamidase-related amidase